MQGVRVENLKKLPPPPTPHSHIESYHFHLLDEFMAPEYDEEQRIDSVEGLWEMSGGSKQLASRSDITRITSHDGGSRGIHALSLDGRSLRGNHRRKQQRRRIIVAL
jgi:hypothetical protein